MATPAIDPVEQFVNDVVNARTFSAKSVRAHQSALRKLTQEEFSQKVAPALDKGLKRSPEVCIPVFQCVLQLTHTLQLSLLSSPSCINILESLLDACYGTNATQSQLLLSDVLDRTCDDKEKLCEAVLRHSKSKVASALLPACVVFNALGCACANSTGLVKSAQTIMNVFLPVIKSTPDPVCKVAALAVCMSWLHLAGDDTPMVLEFCKVLNDALGKDSPAQVQLPVLRLVLLLSEGAKADLGTVLTPRDKFPGSNTKFFNAHSNIVRRIVAYSSSAQSESCPNFAQLLQNRLYAPVMPSGSHWKTIVSSGVFTMECQEGKKGPSRMLIDALVALVAGGLEAGPSNPALQQTKRVLGAAACALLLRLSQAQVELGAKTKTVLASAVSAGSPFYSDTVIARLTQEELYGYVSFLHDAVTMSDTLATSATVDADAVLSITWGQKYADSPLYKFIGLVHESLDACCASAQSLPSVRALSALIKLNVRDSVTEDTVRDGLRKCDPNMPLSFISNVLERVVSTSAHRMTIVLTLLGIASDKYSFPRSFCWSGTIPMNPKLTSAGKVVMGILKQTVGQEIDDVINTAALLLTHHPAVVQCEKERELHSGKHSWSMDTVSVALEMLPSVDGSSVWQTAKNARDILLSASVDKSPAVCQHARALFTSYLCASDSTCMSESVCGMVNELWKDVAQIYAIRKEHVAIWSGRDGETVDVVAAEAVPLKASQDKYNLTGKSDEEIAEEEKKKKAAATPVPTPKPQPPRPQPAGAKQAKPKPAAGPSASAKEDAYKTQVLAGQTDVRQRVNKIVEQALARLSLLWVTVGHGGVVDPSILRAVSLFLPAVRVMSCCLLPTIANAATEVAKSCYDALRIGCHSTASAHDWSVICDASLKNTIPGVPAFETMPTSVELPLMADSDKPSYASALQTALNNILLAPNSRLAKAFTESDQPLSSLIDFVSGSGIVTDINDASFLGLVPAIMILLRTKVDWESRLLKAVVVSCLGHLSACRPHAVCRSLRASDAAYVDVYPFVFAKTVLHLMGHGPAASRLQIHKCLMRSLNDLPATSVATSALLDGLLEVHDHVRATCLALLESTNMSTWTEVSDEMIYSRLFVSCFDTGSSANREAARRLFRTAHGEKVSRDAYKYLITLTSSTVVYVRKTAALAIASAAYKSAQQGASMSAILADLFTYCSKPSSTVIQLFKPTSLASLTVMYKAAQPIRCDTDPLIRAYPQNVTYAAYLGLALAALPKYLLAEQTALEADSLLGVAPGAPPVVIGRGLDMPDLSREYACVADIVEELACALAVADLVPVFEYLNREGFTCSDSSVRDALISCGLSIIRVHSAEPQQQTSTPNSPTEEVDPLFATPKALFARNTHKYELAGRAKLVEQLGPWLDKQLSKPASADSAEQFRKQAAVVLMGGLASCLSASDPAVKKVLSQLTDALDTPEAGVQRCIAECFSTLAKLITVEDRDNLIAAMLNNMQNSPSRNARKGAAQGLAGIIKAMGLAPALTKADLLEKLKSMVKSPNDGAREAALVTFEHISRMFGSQFEPFVIKILPVLLDAYSDPSKDVRAQSESAANQIMSNLSPPGVRFVLNPLLEAVKGDQWRTKAGAVVLLGSMSHCAPKQLGACLPQIVPCLAEVLTDTHARVQEAGQKALREIVAVVKNPEIQAMSQELIRGLENPTQHMSHALDVLLGTTFMDTIDAPSLALIIPIIQNGLSDRNPDNVKKAAESAAHMCGLTQPRDLQPYLPKLEPDLRSLLFHPLPDIRTASSHAMGILVRQFGEAPFKDLTTHLIGSLKSTSTIERLGAAQGLAEVLAALGETSIQALLPDIINNCLNGTPSVREGFLGLFVFLPEAFGSAFATYVGAIFPALITGLADESEPVRKTAMRAATQIIRKFSTDTIINLVPSFRAGLIDPNWRIRVASVQLLGDFLYRLSGVSGKVQQDLDDDDDEMDTITSVEGSKSIMSTLGEDLRNGIFATLYMARSDTEQIVRQEALHVWKTVVQNTPKTVREILPNLTKLAIEALSSDSDDRRKTGSKALGDIVSRMRERVFKDVLIVLSEGLETDNANSREGVCLGLCEVIRAAGSVLVTEHMEVLVAAVKKGLCDEVGSVRETAAQAFGVLHEAVGRAAIDDVVPPLLEKVEVGVAVDPTADFALDGMRQILSVSASAVLPVLVPKLLEEPITVAHLGALAALSLASGDSFFPHLRDTLDILRKVPVAAYARAQGESQVLQLEDGANLDTVVKAARDAGAAVASQVSINSLGTFMVTLAEGLRHENAQFRSATGLQLAAFLESVQRDNMSHISPEEDLDIDEILRIALVLYADKEECANLAGVEVMKIATAFIRKELAAKYIAPLRSNLAHCVQDKKVRDPNYKLPALSIPDGFISIMNLLHNAMSLGAPDAREQAALCISELTQLTVSADFQQHARKVVGPIIKIASEKFAPSVRIALLQALIVVMKASPDIHKMFMSPLSITISKALVESSVNVRLKACEALHCLASITTNAMYMKSLFKEVLTILKTATDAPVRDSCLRALAGILTQAGSLTDAATLDALMVIVNDHLTNEDPGIRRAAAQLGGVGVRLWTATSFTDYVLGNGHIDTSSPVLRQIRAEALSCALAWRYTTTRGTGGKDPFEDKTEELYAILKSDLKDDKSTVRLTALQGIRHVLTHWPQEHEQQVQSLIKACVGCIGSCLRDEATDCRLLACSVVKRLGRRHPRIARDTAVLVTVIPPLLLCVKEKNMPVKLAAERACYLCLGVDQSQGEAIVNEVEAALRQNKEETAVKTLHEYYSRVFSQMARQGEESDDELPGTSFKE